jgi:endoglucanase
MIGVKRLEPFVKWLKANNYKGIVGEFSVPANLDRDPRWLIVLDNVYEYLQKNEIPSTFWAAGTLWTQGRCYVIEPSRRNNAPDKGKDRPQTQILLKHARAYAGAAEK